MAQAPTTTQGSPGGMSPWQRIKRFVANSRRTLLSATTANEIVDPLNCLLGLRGVSGAKVTWADTGPVVSLDKNTIPPDWPQGEGSTGTVNWKGDWAADVNYVEGDVVIRPTATAMDVQKAGTFICIADHINQEPPAGETMNNSYWETFARGHWVRIVAKDGFGKTDILGGRITIEMDAESPPTTVDLGRVNAIPAALVGKTFKPQVWDICVDGVMKKIGVITTDPWEGEA